MKGDQSAEGVDHSHDVPPHQHGGTDAPECTTCSPAGAIWLAHEEGYDKAHAEFCRDEDGACLHPSHDTPAADQSEGPANRKRLDESSARVESGPRACDGTPQGCIVKPCNSPVPCGGCCWCLGGCDVDPAPAAEPADHPEFPEDGEACACGMHAVAEPAGDERELAKLWLFAETKGEFVSMAREILARRDEKRDREAVGRLRALADEWDSFADRDNTGDAVRRAHKRCASDLRAALAEIEPRSTCAACGEPVEPPAALVGDQTFHDCRCRFIHRAPGFRRWHNDVLMEGPPR